MQRTIKYDPVFELHLLHTSNLLWMKEYEKLKMSFPPYDCDDDEALKRFDSILKSGENKQIVKKLNTSRPSAK